jgi:PAS domain S-box-containing protein
MALTSLVDKKYVIVNDIFLSDSGYSRGEVIGKTSEELRIFFNERDREDLLTNVLKYGHVYGMEAKIRTKSGENITCLIYSTLIKLSGAPYLISSIVDITKRKDDEAKLRLSETRLSNAMKIARLGHWEYDVVKDLFTFNEQFYDVFRTTADKEGGYTMSSSEYSRRFVHPDDAQIVGNEIHKAIETADPNYSGQLEHRIIYTDGEV